MAAVVAIIMGGVACYELIENLISLVKPCSWQGVALIISTTALVVSIAGVFVFGILTIVVTPRRLDIIQNGFFLNPPRNTLLMPIKRISYL